MWLLEQKLSKLTAEELRQLKGRGFSDAQIGRLVGSSTAAVRSHRKALGVVPSFKRVDTCAAEFQVRLHLAFIDPQNAAAHAACGCLLQLLAAAQHHTSMLVSNSVPAPLPCQPTVTLAVLNRDTAGRHPVHVLHV